MQFSKCIKPDKLDISGLLVALRRGANCKPTNQKATKMNLNNLFLYRNNVNSNELIGMFDKLRNNISPSVRRETYTGNMEELAAQWAFLELVKVGSAGDKLFLVARVDMLYCQLRDHFNIKNPFDFSMAIGKVNRLRVQHERSCE